MIDKYLDKLSWYEEYKRMLLINEGLTEQQHYLNNTIFDYKQKINDQELIISKLRNQLKNIFNTCKSNINIEKIEEDKN